MQQGFNPNDFKDKKGMINNILHLNKFVTPKVITVLYWILLAFLALVFIVMVLSGLINLVRGDIMSGLLVIIASPIATFTYWIFIRVNVELTIVAFKNNEYLKKISENNQ